MSTIPLTNYVDDTQREARGNGRNAFPTGQHFHDMHPECFISESMTAKQIFQTTTPLDKQIEWVSVKKKNPDAIVLVKVGRFFELFHGDADVLVTECEAIYMLGRMAHTGIPDTALQRYTDMLSKKGYKICVIL